MVQWSKGNGPKWGTWPTTAPFRPIFVAMILKCRQFNDTSRVSWWWDMTNWWWKVGFTPRAIRHVRRNWQFSSSGVAKIPLGTRFRNCQMGREYSIHMFRASVDPLWYNTIVFLSNFGSADFWPKIDPARPIITQNVINSSPIFLYVIILYNSIESSLKDRCWGGICLKRPKNGKKR